MDHVDLFRLAHVLGILLLTGFTFAAFANPNPVHRRKILICAGTSSLVAMIAGFGLSGLLKIGFPAKVLVKIACWLGLTALAGLAFRRPRLIPVWTALSILLLAAALSMVYIAGGGETASQ